MAQRPALRGGSEYNFWRFCNTQFVPVFFTVYLLHELKVPAPLYLNFLTNLMRGPASNFKEKTLSSQRGAIALGTAAVASDCVSPAGAPTLPAPHARRSPVGHRPGPLGSQGQCKKGAHTLMRLCCLYICCLLLTVCVLLSTSRDEEVVGRSQVRQPGGEFNCPRVGDQRQDRERIKASLHRDLGCQRGIQTAGGTIV